MKNLLHITSESKIRKFFNGVSFNECCSTPAQYPYVALSTVPYALLCVVLLASYTPHRFINKNTDAVKSLKQLQNTLLPEEAGYMPKYVLISGDHKTVFAGIDASHAVYHDRTLQLGLLVILRQ